MDRVKGHVGVAKVAMATPPVQNMPVDNFSEIALTSSFFLSWSSRGYAQAQGGVAMATLATPTARPTRSVLA